MKGIALSADDAKQVAFAISRAGFEPDDCEVLSTPRSYKDTEGQRIHVVHVQVPDGRRLSVRF